MKAIYAVLLLFGAALANHHYDSTTRRWGSTNTPVWKTTYEKPNEGDKSTPNRRYDFTTRRWGSTKLPFWKTTYGKPQGGDTTTPNYDLNDLSTTRPYQPTRRRVRRQDYTTAAATAGRTVKSTVKPVKPSSPPSTNDDPFVNELNQFWEKHYVLREGLLLDLLVYADKHKEQNVGEDIKNLSERKGLPYKFDTFLSRYQNISEVMNYVKEFRDPPRSHSISFHELVGTFDRNSSTGQETFFDKLGRVGPAYHFFEKFRSLDNGYGDFMLIYEMPLLFRPSQWREMLNYWMVLSPEQKSLVKNVMSRECGEKECRSVWERLQNDLDMENVIRVIGIKSRWNPGESCFSRFSIRDDRERFIPLIDLREYWGGVRSSELVELLEYAANHDGFITETSSIGQISKSGDLFTQLDLLLNKYSKFGQMVDVMIETRKLNLTKIESITKSFYSISSAEKEEMLSHVDGATGGYLDDIWFVKSVMPNLKLLESFNDKVSFDFLKKVIRAYADFDKKEKSIVKVVFTDATREVCKKVLGDKVKIVEMAKALDSKGFKSCFKNFGLY